MANVFETQPSVVERPSRPLASIPFQAVEPLLAFSDGLIVVLAAIAGGTAYQLAISGSAGDVSVYVGLGLVASLTYTVTAHRLGLYRVDGLLGRQRDDARVCAGWSLAILVLAVVLFLFKSGADISRGAVMCFSVLGGMGLVLGRRVAKKRVHAAFVRGAIRGRRAILVGTQSELGQFARGELLVRFGLDEIERIALPRDGVSSLSSGFRQAAIETALQQIKQTSAEQILLALPWSDTADVELLVDQFRVVPLPVYLLPDRAVSAVLKRQTRMLPRSHLIEVQRAPLTPLERLAKRSMDVMVAIIALVLFAPLMLTVAVAIKLGSRGPVIFRQRRHGFNGQPFVIYKFRTMTVLEDDAAVVQAKREDARVTRLGRILRRTSVDELPQLLNVLRGEMSIVGPRPHALVHDYEYGKLIANYAFRHHVRPGITGWAQVHGSRGATPRLELMERRIALDLWYINNWSLGLDIHIILRTFIELLRPRNAY